MPFLLPSEVAMADGTYQVLNVVSGNAGEDEASRSKRIQIKNRRKRYLDTHPEYFGASLELADPLLYDQLIRRFQTTAEREAEGHEKGYSGVLEADIVRSEAKLDAIHNAGSSSTTRYLQASSGEIFTEDKSDPPKNKEDATARWRDEMEMRFLRGEDRDFDYRQVDESDEWDDRTEAERDIHDKYFQEEEPSWAIEDGKVLSGETGVQDF